MVADRLRISTSRISEQHRQPYSARIRWSSAMQIFRRCQTAFLIPRRTISRTRSAKRQPARRNSSRALRPLQATACSPGWKLPGGPSANAATTFARAATDGCVPGERRLLAQSRPQLKSGEAGLIRRGALISKPASLQLDERNSISLFVRQFAQRASSASMKERSHRPSRIACMVASSLARWSPAFSINEAAISGANATRPS